MSDNAWLHQRSYILFLLACGDEEAASSGDLRRLLKSPGDGSERGSPNPYLLETMLRALHRSPAQLERVESLLVRIFDAVDLYPHLQNLTEMKPVVVDPDITLEQLFGEFARLEDEKHREAVREQILVKMRRRIKRLHQQARARYEAEAGEPPEATLKRITEEPTATVAAKDKTSLTHTGLLMEGLDGGDCASLTPER